MKAFQGFIALTLVGAVASGQDALQLTNGRCVTGPAMTRTPGGVRIHFKNGDVLVKTALVREAAVARSEGAVDDKPLPDAAEKMAQGFVRFEGKWVKKEQRDALVEEQNKARAKKIQDALDHREW